MPSQGIQKDGDVNILKHTNSANSVILYTSMYDNLHNYAFQKVAPTILSELAFSHKTSLSIELITLNIALRGISVLSIWGCAPDLLLQRSTTELNNM